MRSIPPVLRAGTLDLSDVAPLVQWLIGEFLAPIMRETIPKRGQRSRKPFTGAPV